MSRRVSFNAMEFDSKLSTLLHFQKMKRNVQKREKKYVK